MTSETRPPTTDDLHAFADGALDEAARAAVEAYLAGNPQRAAEVEDWRRQNRALITLYGHVSDEPVPERLQRALDPPSPAPALQRFGRIAAMLALLLIGGAAGWYGRGLAPGTVDPVEELASQATLAHSVFAGEVMHPVEVRAAEHDHLQAWLSKKLDRPLVIPDLRKAGLTLVGGRLLPSGQGAAAQLMYEDESGRRMTLYVVPIDEGIESAFRYARRSGLETLSWEDERIRCALVADMPRDRLRQIADEAYRQLG